MFVFDFTITKQLFTLSSRTTDHTPARKQYEKQIFNPLSDEFSVLESEFI